MTSKGNGQIAKFFGLSLSLDVLYPAIMADKTNRRKPQTSSKRLPTSFRDYRKQ